MKYYKDIDLSRYLKIFYSGLTFVDQDYSGEIRFVKNIKYNNCKNASYISKYIKEYYINGKIKGDQDKFKSNKEWRKYCKLLAFI